MPAGKERPPSAPSVRTLQAEIARLNKIVEALMDRSEASMNVRGSDFGLFQTTIMLQDQVRLHTEALEAALRHRTGETSSPRESAWRDMQTLRRTAALQIQLLELVAQQKDVGELIDRVSTILSMPIVLFDTHGKVVCCSGSARDSAGLADRLWAAHHELNGAADPAGAVTATGERVFCRDVLVMAHSERVLVAVAGPGQSTDLASASLLFLQQLVTLDLLRSRDELRMRRRLRRALLRDVLAGSCTPEELRIRLQAQGFAEESILRVAVLEPLDQTPPQQAPGSPATGRRGTRLLSALDDFLSRRRIPYLTSADGALAIVLTALPDHRMETARALLGDLREAAAPAVSPHDVVAGASAPLAGAFAAGRGLQQAKAACMAARRTRESDGAAIFDELSGQYRLLDGLDEDALEAIVRRTFAPLLEYDAQHHASLYETVHTLFEHQMAVQETAQALHIHRNTLQKRLANVERLLGVDLAELDVIVDIRLGLHAAELLGRHLR